MRECVCVWCVCVCVCVDAYTADAGRPRGRQCLQYERRFHVRSQRQARWARHMGVQTSCNELTQVRQMCLCVRVCACISLCPRCLPLHAMMLKASMPTCGVRCMTEEAVSVANDTCMQARR